MAIDLKNSASVAYDLCMQKCVPAGYLDETCVIDSQDIFFQEDCSQRCSLAKSACESFYSKARELHGLIDRAWEAEQRLAEMESGLVTVHLSAELAAPTKYHQRHAAAAAASVLLLFYKDQQILDAVGDPDQAYQELSIFTSIIPNLCSVEAFRFSAFPL